MNLFNRDAKSLEQFLRWIAARYREALPMPQGNALLAACKAYANSERIFMEDGIGWKRSDAIAIADRDMETWEERL